ncbi:DUF1836 domain-containing protein [Clostridium thermarum]|uniref:DUF1836 domain-containing protein n=1 Tax=Clostridium thermarum TaxID=1716543 RepID=UPI0013D44A4E|nr:DUF1836 domain-containing protein [Clostridium thermarum]
MEYSLENIEALLSTMKNSDEIKSADIPCIDLYMDQVTTLFDDKLSSQKRNDEDAVLTKTMINNYAKAKILPPIKNKRYNKQQIMLLVLIYNLKQILSLEDIKAIFDPILIKLSANPNDADFLHDIYEQFLDEKGKQANNLIDNFINELGTSESEVNQMDLLMKVLLLISSATIQKRMAEKIIDTYFKNEK